MLTWARAGARARRSARERLRALQASHHAMWNYVTYRDAIALVGVDPDELYPEGTTRLPGDWADLGWLTCFHGPARVGASRRCAPRSCPTRSTSYPPDLIEPLRDEAARALGRERDGSFEVVGTEGAQAGLALALLAAIDPGDEVILGDPGYFHLPAAVHRRRRRARDRADRARAAAIASTPTPWRRRSRRARARSAWSTRSTRTARVADRRRGRRARPRWPSATGCCSSTTSPTGCWPSTPARRRCAAPAGRARGGDLLGLALLRHGRRAHGLPRRAAARSCAAACSSRRRSRG